MNEAKRVRALLVGEAVDPSLHVDVDVEAAPTVDHALARLEGEHGFDIVLLGPSPAPRAMLACLQERAPQVPIVVLPRVPSDHLRVAVETATRNPRTAAANARRVASLLPSYLARRVEDVRALTDALQREDYEPIARTGHNLRGNGVSFGFPELSAIGEDLEAAAGTRSKEGIRDAITRLGECLR